MSHLIMQWEIFHQQTKDVKNFRAVSDCTSGLFSEMKTLEFMAFKSREQKYKFLQTWIKTLLFSVDEWWMKADASSI